MFNIEKIEEMMKKLVLLIFLALSGHSLYAFYPFDYVVPEEFTPAQNKETYSKKSLNPEKIDILIWNIFKSDKESFLLDFMDLSYGKDILMLQEVTTKTDYDYVQKARSNEYGSVFGTSFFIDNGEDVEKGEIMSASGTAILSKVAPNVFGAIRSKVFEPISSTPKVVTYGTYPLKGMSENLLLINIHGLNVADDEHFVEQINECIELLKKHKGPALFGGDFNSRNEFRINYLLKAMQNEGFRSVNFEDDNRMLSLWDEEILDHIFIRGLIALESAAPATLGSDHAPMIVSIKVQALP
jgi:endonuclease/exonuclease/phosphatase (EEP) superfamily protein YafD